MELDYTLISSSRAVTGAEDLIKTFGPHGQDQFSVEQIRPSMQEVVDLQRDHRTIALTPTMPMSLITPVLMAKDDLSVESDIAWGVRMVEAHKSRFDGRGAIVAVLDTGVQLQHKAFADVSIVAENFTNDVSAADGNGHGTHCAGTVAGHQIDGIRIGVAPGVDKLLCGKVLTNSGAGSTTALVKGVQWASMQGAHVISMSLGLDFPAYVESLHKGKGLELQAAVSLALQAYTSNVDMFSKLGDSLSALSYIGQGSLIVAAAGNESRRPRYTIGTAPPAVAAPIVSVAAVDSTMKVAGFSNTDADISAPGVQISSAGLDGGVSVMSGTSMATPHLAGVAALWVQKFLESDSPPGVEQLRTALFSSVLFPESHTRADISDIGRGIVVSPAL